MKKDLPLVMLIVTGIIFLVVCAFVVTHKVTQDSAFSSDESKERFSEIIYNVPDIFEESSYFTFRSYHYDSNQAYLDIDVKSAEKELYKDANNYIKENVRYTLSDKVSELKEIEINGIKMHTVTVENENEISYYYAMETTNYIYLFEFQIMDFKNGDRDDLDTNPCFTTKEKVLYSIKIK